MKGASTTRHEFDQMFRNYDEWNQALASEIPDVAKGNDTILSRVKTLRQQVRTRFPTWSDYLICLGAAALAANVARLTDRPFVGDNAFFLWLVEGIGTFEFTTAFAIYTMMMVLSCHTVAPHRRRSFFACHFSSVTWKASLGA